MPDKTFFLHEYQHFFRPLTGKYREKSRACIQDLYSRLYGPMADYGYHLKREDVLDIFLHALQRAPDLDGDDAQDDEQLTDEELAKRVLKRLIEEGWLEEYLDDVLMKKAYRFTPVGRIFGRSFIDVGREQRLANHRNTRNARNALAAYLEHGDPFDLVEADTFAQEVFNDFNESIEEVELIQRQQARQIAGEVELRQASAEFFDYLKERFIPNISRMMSNDSVARYRQDIKSTLENIRALPNDVKAEREVQLRRECPMYQRYAGPSILIWLLDHIERCIDNACEVKLPELRRVLEGFTRRTEMVIQQMSRIYASDQHDVAHLCRRLAEQTDGSQENLLSQAGQVFHRPVFELVNPEQIRVLKRRQKEQLDVMVEHLADPNDDMLKEAAIRNALDSAFAVEDGEVIESIVNHLKNKDETETRDLPIKDIKQLYAAMHALTLGSNHHDKPFRFVVEETDEMVKNDYFYGKNFKIRIEPNPQHSTLA